MCHDKIKLNINNKYTPLISIIIPIYNVEEYIKECVLSACRQTFINLEIILVNDGSTDKSSNICNELALKDYRIKIINKENGGLSSARNAGIETATGDYVFFLDGDDFIKEDTIELLLKEFKTQNNIGIVSAPCFYSYNNGQKTIYKEDWNIKENRIIEPEKFCINTLTQTSCHSACCKLYKKDLLNKVRFRIGKKNEDTLFMFDLSFIMRDRQFYMLEIPNKLYFYRVNDKSITNNKLKPIQIDIVENLLLMMRETTDCETIKTLKLEYYKNIINYYSQLITDPELLEQIETNSLKLINNYFNNINFSDVVQYCSNKNILKYILIKLIRPLYTKSIAIKRKLT